MIKVCFVVSILLLTTILVTNTKADGTIISPDGLDSPIRKYFTTQKILWTFDDYYISENQYPPHKGFGGLSQRIGSYGGYVGINCVFAPDWIINKYGNEIRNYSVIPEFSKYTSGFSQTQINKSLAFFNLSYIEAESHGWNHAENLNYASLSYAYNIINFTLWNWYNNYHIKPSMWLGHNLDGNYNISVALKKFSEKYWIVYAEDLRVQNEQRFPNHKAEVEFIGTFFDPTFGCNWGTPKITVVQAKQKFTTFAQGKDIVPVRCHPAFLNGTNQQATENLTKWQQFIDWIYQNHTYINMKHPEAVEYKVDRNNFSVIQINSTSYVIDLTNCKYDHNVLFTNPNGNNQITWTVRDNLGNYIGSVNNDVFLMLKNGIQYTLSTTPTINLPPNSPQAISPVNNTINVPTHPTLSWTATDPDNDTLKYDVYFGPSTHLYKVKTNQTSKTYSTWSLEYNTKYCWRIVVRDSHGATTAGPLWTFVTKKKNS